VTAASDAIRRADRLAQDGAEIRVRRSRPPRRTRRLRAVALLLAAAALSTSACSRPRVLVLGLDGADWDVIDPLMEGGYLPTIAGLVRSGVRVDLDCRPANLAYPCYCPPVWMSVATGQDFGRHGIARGSQPVEDRRAKALWTVLGEHSRGPLADDGSSKMNAWLNLCPP